MSLKAQCSEDQPGENAEENNTKGLSKESAEFSSCTTVKDVEKLSNVDIVKLEARSVLFKAGKPGCDGDSDLDACYTTPYPDNAQGFSALNYHVTEVMEDAQNLADFSDDFASTFMLDEELELEQKSLKNDGCSPVRRYCMI